MELLELLTLSPALRLGLAVVLGLLVGSFLNVVIHRVPLMLQRDWRQQCMEFLSLDEKQTPMADPVPDHRRFNLVTPGSHCPHCNTAIRPWQNIPVVSYLMLRGRCGSCGGRIAARYPIVEAVSGALAFLVVWQYGATLDTLALLVFTWSLLALTLIDADHQLLPDNITLPLLWLGLLLSVWGIGTGIGPRDALLGAVLGYLSLWSIYWLFRLATGKEGMGYGDFKLLAALGAWLGWQHLLTVILLSSLVGAVVGTLQLTLGGRDRTRPIPFGPYLAGAGFLTLLFGDPLMAAWLSAVRP